MSQRTLKKIIYSMLKKKKLGLDAKEIKLKIEREKGKIGNKSIYKALNSLIVESKVHRVWKRKDILRSKGKHGNPSAIFTCFPKKNSKEYELELIESKLMKAWREEDGSVGNFITIIGLLNKNVDFLDQRFVQRFKKSKNYGQYKQRISGLIKNLQKLL